MKITDFLTEDMILPEIRATEKSAVICELARFITAHHPALKEAAVAQVLAERETLASTAIGEGVAIPHGKLASVSSLIACIGRSLRGVDFDSLDGRETHLFFVLVAPEGSTGVHLKALARVSRLFKNQDFRSRLIAATNSRDMYQVVVEEDGQ